MSDVWRELEERLKQKAWEPFEIPQWVLYRSKWVRLEDVKEAIQQLKQSILDEIIELIHKLEREIGLMVVDGLGADITDSFIQNLQEELLRKNG